MIASALMHRDYSQAGGAVSIDLFSDRLEVSSPGGIPNGHTLEDILGTHGSIQRNPTIARAFYLRGLVDEVGKGIGLLNGRCMNQGHPKPEFFANSGRFTVQLLSSVALGLGGAKRSGREAVLSVNQ